jgi:hypothetical protein
MQNIKPSDMTKLEEFSLLLAANGEPDTNPNPVEIGNPLMSAPPLEAENSTGNTLPLWESPVKTFSEQPTSTKTIINMKTLQNAKSAKSARAGKNKVTCPVIQ